MELSAGELGRWLSVDLPAAPIAIPISRSIVRRLVDFSSDDAQSAFLVALTEVVADALDSHARLDIPGGPMMTVDFGDRHQVRVTSCRERDRSGRGTASEGTTGFESPLARAFVPDMSFQMTPTETTAVLPLTGFGQVR